jgi:DNA replicative helicase MCM subunit Mcm2 (Cdc46/Mcm family)
MMAMVGGQRIETESHKIRGDINILIIGDPGLGKS